MKRLMVLLCLASLALTGCAGPTAVLSLQYTGAEKAIKSYPVKVALVEPKHSKDQNLEKIAAGQAQMMLAATYMATPPPLPLDVQILQKYNAEYVPRLQSALHGDIERLLAGKGMTVMAKYASFDEIPFAAKKEIDLIVVSEFNFSPLILDRMNKMLFVFGPLVHTGSVELNGRLEITMVEPMSKELILIKKVDLSSNRITYNDEAGAHDALVNLLNTTYPQIIQKAAAIMDSDEIAVAAKDVQQLKEKKRY